MEQFKRAKVIMLPTLLESKIHLFTGNKQGLYQYPKNINVMPENPHCLNQHLYIISDDKIKENDWCYNIVSKTIFQANEDFIKLISDPNVVLTTNKKIIATTDTSLKTINYIGTHPKYGDAFEGKSLPQPSQQFIEKYIESYNKGEIITDVLVEYDFVMCLNEPKCINCYSKCLISYKLKVNPKDNTITIKKVKDNWNKDEVIKILNKLNNTLNIGSDLTLEEWIKKNL
jgi:hypothetical protein